MPHCARYYHKLSLREESFPELVSGNVCYVPQFCSMGLRYLGQYVSFILVIIWDSSLDYHRIVNRRHTQENNFFLDNHVVVTVYHLQLMDLLLGQPASGSGCHQSEDQYLTLRGATV